MIEIRYMITYDGPDVRLQFFVFWGKFHIVFYKMANYTAMWYRIISKISSNISDFFYIDIDDVVPSDAQYKNNKKESYTVIWLLNYVLD